MAIGFEDDIESGLALRVKRPQLSEAVLEELARLGERALRLEAVLGQFSTAWTNAGHDAWERFGTPLFEGIDDERERIRARLLEINDELADLGECAGE